MAVVRESRDILLVVRRSGRRPLSIGSMCKLDVGGVLRIVMRLRTDTVVLQRNKRLPAMGEDLIGEAGHRRKGLDFLVVRRGEAAPRVAQPLLLSNESAPRFDPPSWRTAPAALRSFRQP